MSSDKWNIGTLHKEGIWAYFVLSNYVGVLLCSILLYSVYKNPKRNSTDIMISGLCSGCMGHSITCGTQCLLNMIDNRFYGGNLACQIEAIAHISSVLTQFFCVAGIAIRSYLVVVRKYDLAPKAAIKIVVSIWIFCTLLTGLFSLFSPIYLVNNGTFCFFEWSSFAIIGWLFPGLLLALGIMSFCYFQIWRHFRQSQVLLEAALRIVGSNNNSTKSSSQSMPTSQLSTGQPPTGQPPTSEPSTPPNEQCVELTELKSVTVNSGPDEVAPPSRSRNMTFFGQTAQTESCARNELTHIDVALRSLLYIFILLLGWGFAAVTSVYALAAGHATEWLVTAVGVGAVSFSWWVPIAYAFTSDFHKRTMKKLFGWTCIPCRGKRWWEDAWIISRRSNSLPCSTVDAQTRSPFRSASSSYSPDSSVTPSRGLHSKRSSRSPSSAMIPTPKNSSGSSPLPVLHEASEPPMPSNPTVTV